MRPVIIGSGMGGLTIGLILKKNNLNPIIFEKNNHYGGSFWSYKVKRYQVDTGLHMLTRGSTGELPVLMKKYISKNIFKGNFVDQKAYEFHLRNKHDNLPGNLKEILNFRILEKEDRKAFVKMLLHFLRITRKGTNFKGSTYDHVKKYIKSKDMLYFLNSLSWMCNGCSIKEGSLSRFVDMFIRQRELSLGYIMKHLSRTRGFEEDWYPKGGLKKVPELFVNQGLDVKTKSKVSKIVIKNNEVKGVKIGNKVYKTDLVIHDGLVKDLKKMTNNKIKIKTPKYDEYKAITIWLGFKKKVANWKRVSKLRIQESLDAPHWGAFVTDFDRSLAPKNHQLFGMSSILHKNKREMIKEMKQSIEILIPEYEKYLDMEHIQIVRAEKTLQKKNNNIFTLPEQKTNIKGLYIVGTDTKGWGNGGTLCADSANRCWNFIRKDYKYKK